MKEKTLAETSHTLYPIKISASFLTQWHDGCVYEIRMEAMGKTVKIAPCVCAESPEGALELASGLGLDMEREAKTFWSQHFAERIPDTLTWKPRLLRALDDLAQHSLSQWRRDELTWKPFGGKEYITVEDTEEYTADYTDEDRRFVRARWITKSVLELDWTNPPRSPMEFWLSLEPEADTTNLLDLSDEPDPLIAN